MIPQIKGQDPNPKWEEYDFSEEYDTPLGKLKIVKTSPYGFRELVLESGAQLPSEYQGSFTTPFIARLMKDKLIEEFKDAPSI